MYIYDWICSYLLTYPGHPGTVCIMIGYVPICRIQLYIYNSCRINGHRDYPIWLEKWRRQQFLRLVNAVAIFMVVGQFCRMPCFSFG